MFIKSLFSFIIFVLLFCLKSDSQVSKKDSSSLAVEIYGGYTKEFISFFYKLKRNLKKNDSVEIANQIFYPLTVAYVGKKGSIKIDNKKEFLKLYFKLFDNRMKNFILNESADSVFSNYEGIVLGPGRIWIEQRLNSNTGKIITKIVTINNADDIWPKK